jgi:hypothetical protein
VLTPFAGGTQQDPQLYRLIRWVLSSNRAFIKKIDPDLVPTSPTQHTAHAHLGLTTSMCPCLPPQHLSAMQTPYQYLLLSSPPERKAKFDSYRLQYGSFFAFHGSALVRTPFIVS